jgi:hypothetical protein
MYVCMSVSLSACLSVFMSVCLFLCMSVYMYTHQFQCYYLIINVEHSVWINYATPLWCGSLRHPVMFWFITPPRYVLVHYDIPLCSGSLRHPVMFWFIRTTRYVLVHYDNPLCSGTFEYVACVSVFDCNIRAVRSVFIIAVLWILFNTVVGVQ